jgi:integrase
VKGRKPVRVRDATVNADFRWLASCFNLAVDHDVNGAPLLSKNRLRRLKLPKEKNPRRPVASHERFTRTLEHTNAIDELGRLTCVLNLARYTGRRIDAILHLRVSDVLLTRERLHETLAGMGRDERLVDHMPFGAIRWRAEHDKMGFDELAPIGPDTRRALDDYLRANRRVGDAVLVPAPENDAAFLGRRLATRWLLKAEKLAKLPKLDQGCWHPYRRLWAVERKDLPDVDTAAAGGWRDTRALKLSYQQADPATMLRVVLHAR